MKPLPAALAAFLAFPLSYLSQAAEPACAVFSADLPAGVEVWGPAVAVELVTRLGIPVPERPTALAALIVDGDALVVVSGEHTCTGVRVPREAYEAARRKVAGVGA